MKGLTISQILNIIRFLPDPISKEKGETIIYSITSRTKGTIGLPEEEAIYEEVRLRFKIVITIADGFTWEYQGIDL